MNYCKLFTKGKIKDEEWREASSRRDQNLEGEPPESNDNLWYPERKKIKTLDKVKLKTRGKYKSKFPEGAVIHYTAGRGHLHDCRGKTFEQLAVDHLKWQAAEGKFCYFLIDTVGNVYQQFSLDEWGYHAGKSSWQGISGSVSNEFVGIEIMNAGRVNKIDENKYRAWFTVTEKGDKYYNKDQVRYSSGGDNIKRGYYLKFSYDQEKALKDLLFWMLKAGNGTFKIKNIVGHDEVSPERKDDPGASLSMTMKELRKKVIDKKIADKDLTEKDLLNVL